VGILQERIAEAMKRYARGRRPDVVYVHMLDAPVWVALAEKGAPASGEVLVGEIIHLGAERVLDPAEERCREVQVSAEGAVPPALERFVKFGPEGKPFVEVCGRADGLHEGRPVELKTTRSSRRPRSPEREWVRRARMYAWLYGADRGYVAVFNVITGEEEDHEVPAYTDEEVREILEKWLRGEFPSATLPVMAGNQIARGRLEDAGHAGRERGLASLAV